MFGVVSHLLAHRWWNSLTDRNAGSGSMFTGRDQLVERAGQATFTVALHDLGYVSVGSPSTAGSDFTI